MLPRTKKALSRLTLAISAGVFLLPTNVWSTVEPVAELSQQGAAFVTSAQLARAATGRRGITWEVRLEGAGPNKRLVPRGMLPQRCLPDQAPLFQLSQHPNRNFHAGDNQRLAIFTSLNSACTNESGEGVTVNPDVIQQNRQPGTEWVALAADNSIPIPADFSGQIELCGLAAGDPEDNEGRASCTTITINDVPGTPEAQRIVRNGNTIIGAAEQARMAQAQAERDQAARQLAEQRAQYDEARLLMEQSYRQFCNGNILGANSIIARIAREFAGNSGAGRSLTASVNRSSLDAIRASIRSAEDVEAVYAALDRVSRLENTVVDPRAVAALRGQAIDRAIEILRSRASEIERGQASQATGIESEIRALRQRARQELGREANGKMAAIETVRQSLANRLINLGETGRAREVIARGKESTDGAAQLSYIRAERRLAQREFTNCVNTASNNNGRNMERCSRAMISAQRAHRELEQTAANFSSPEELERIRDEGAELFGSGQGQQMVQTPFGPMMQGGGDGEFMNIYQQAIQQMMQNQMLQMQLQGRMNGGAGFGMQQQMPFMMGQQNFGGAGHMMPGFQNVGFAGQGFGGAANFRGATPMF